MQKVPELLAPAGDLTRLKAAVDFGADAVYLAGEAFGMRGACKNFNRAQLAEGVAYAHQHGVKVHVTCNIIPHDCDIAQMPEFLKTLNALGVDAVIAADLGTMTLVQKYAPQCELHVSVQSGVTNAVTATQFFKLGAKRVVLARELSLKEIAEIRQNTPPELELEAFAHGAMCVSFSARCLLSSYMTGRDANHGDCAQPCRWSYALVEEKRPGQYYPVFEDENGSYILNAKDLCLLEHIRELIDAGVTSLKIEGRAKSAYYVSAVTNAYRIAVDGCLADPKGWSCPDWLSEEVRKVSHREYSTGFLFGIPEQRCSEGSYVRTWDVMAIVDHWENGRAYCRQRNKFSDGETLELLEPGKHPEPLLVSDIRNKDGEPVPDTRHANMEFSFDCPRPVVFGAILRKQVE